MFGREIDELRTKPKVFRSMKCALTGAPLEPPTVHILSGNSYNLSALPEPELGQELEDPKLAAEHRAVFAIRANLGSRAGQHEQFFSELEKSTHGFSTVANYFGKRLFADQLRIAVATGQCMPELFAYLVLWRAELPFHTQGIEGMNRTLQLICDAARRIGIALVSDRLQLNYGDPISASDL